MHGMMLTPPQNKLKDGESDNLPDLPQRMGRIKRKQSGQVNFIPFDSTLNVPTGGFEHGQVLGGGTLKVEEPHPVDKPMSLTPTNLGRGMFSFHQYEAHMRKLQAHVDAGGEVFWLDTECIKDENGKTAFDYVMDALKEGRWRAQTIGEALKEKGE